MVGPKEDGYEGEPDDAGGVHGEADVLGLVEVGGDLPGLDGVDGAEEDEDHVVHQGHDQGEGGHPARLHRTRVLTLGVNRSTIQVHMKLRNSIQHLVVHVDDHGVGRLQHQPHDHAQHLLSII